VLSPKINQKLIAKQLKLSPATVSKSFRNHPDISAETRAKVLSHAAQIGYHAEVVGWGSRLGATPLVSRLVGVLIHDNHGVGHADYSGQGYVTGLSEAASRYDTSLIVHRFSGDARLILDPAHQPPAMRQNALHGLILVHRFDAEVVKELAARLPCVTLTFYVPGARADHIDSNYLGAVSGLVEHLHGLGHERIGYVGHVNRPSNSFARFGAFAQALARRGLRLETANVVDVYEPVGDWDRQAEVVERRLREGVTAWVCSVDTVGYNLYRRLRDAGYKVPQDVSITGYDMDEPMFGLPQLTTVRVPFTDMGTYALSRLLERMERPAVPQTQTLLDGEIVHGQSTGTVPQPRRK
jgi:DNA-binding LacI/PurR family transcriptional regulator